MGQTKITLRNAPEPIKPEHLGFLSAYFTPVAEADDHTLTINAVGVRYAQDKGILLQEDVFWLKEASKLLCGRADKDRVLVRPYDLHDHVDALSPLQLHEKADVLLVCNVLQPRYPGQFEDITHLQDEQEGVRISYHAMAPGVWWQVAKSMDVQDVMICGLTESGKPSDINVNLRIMPTVVSCRDFCGNKRFVEGEQKFLQRPSRYFGGRTGVNPYIKSILVQKAPALAPVCG